MGNLLFDAYNYLDDKIMKGISAGVHAWNWTTGETKSELAYKLLTVAPILEGIGYTNNDIPSSIMATPLMIFMSHREQNKAKELEEREAIALDDHMQDLEVISQKQTMKYPSLIWFMAAGVWAIPHGGKGEILPDRNETDLMVTAGHTLRALSYYVMRTDYLPPRKNCASRGIEKLEQLVQSYREKPAFT